MKGTVVDGAVAEESDPDMPVLEQLEAVAGAGGLENARPDDAAGAHQSYFRSEQVHAAAAAMRAAALTPVQLGE